MTPFSIADLSSVVATHPVSAFFVAMGLGLATSLGPCTMAKTMAFSGFIGRQKNLTRWRGLWLGILMTLGISTSLAALGLVSSLLARITQIGTGVYIVVGLAMIVMGIATAGIFNFSIPVPARLMLAYRRYSSKTGASAGSFLLGTLFGFMLCPCCLPGILAIYALAFANGQIAYGFLLIVAFTIGHNAPVMAAGVFASTLARMRSLKSWQNHIEIGMASIMVLGGMFMLWLA